MNTPHHVVIVGGGFGGIRTALTLVYKRIPNLRITLFTNKPHFEYNPALYRYVTGSSAIEVCIPLEEIFSGLSVEVIVDNITAVDKTGKTVTRASGEKYASRGSLALAGARADWPVTSRRGHEYG